jgi:transcriptional regulator of acetoin/glycerol metabolism
MVIEVNGEVVTQVVRFDREQVADGQVITLVRAVILCLHWTTRLPRRNPVPGRNGFGSASIGVRKQIRMVAPSGLPVLLLGETGTGKEIAARAIHALRERAAAPLVAVNMAVLTEALAATELFGSGRRRRSRVRAHCLMLKAFRTQSRPSEELGTAPSRP